MYSAKVMVKLCKDESDALLSLAKQERRDPRAQAAVLIRQQLEKLGLIQPIPTHSQRQESRYDTVK